MIPTSRYRNAPHGRQTSEASNQNTQTNHTITDASRQQRLDSLSNAFKRASRLANRIASARTKHTKCKLVHQWAIAVREGLEG